MGGRGDDLIFGGPGDDLLIGDRSLEPDRFEFVTRGGETSLNDTFQFAADLGAVRNGLRIEDLTFHDGDAEDWYILAVPDSFRQFVGQNAALFTPDMVRARLMKVDSNGVFTTTEQFFETSLFLAENSGTADKPEVVPVGTLSQQELVQAHRTDEGLSLCMLGPCRFVPLLGREAFPQP